MTDTLLIEVDRARADRWFAELIRRGTDLSGLMADIGEALLESTQKRFDSSIGPDGIPWLPLADGSGRKPLLLTGTMRDQIFPNHGRDFIELSATAKQARWHQDGTDHGIPARPFMGLSIGDEQTIDGLAVAWLNLDAAGG